MSRFTIRELKSMVRQGERGGLSKKEIVSIKTYLTSSDAKERIARGRRMAEKRKQSSPFCMPRFGMLRF